MRQINRTALWIGCVNIGILFCGMALISACAPDNDSPLSGPQAAKRGEQVFNYNCGFCHGAEGRGPKLTEIKSLSATELRGKIINHPISGQIPQRLQAHELADLNEFLESD